PIAAPAAEPAVPVAPAETATAEEASVGEAGVLIAAPAAGLAFTVEVRGIEGGIHGLPTAARILLPAAAVVALDVAVRASVAVVACMAGFIGVGLAGTIGDGGARLSRAAAIDVALRGVLDICAGARIRIVGGGAAAARPVASIGIIGGIAVHVARCAGVVV